MLLLASNVQDELFVDFVEQMLNLDPVERLTASEALLHPWLEDADRVDIGEYIIRYFYYIIFIIYLLSYLYIYYIIV